MESYKLTVKILHELQEIEEKEYEIIKEAGNIRCTCEFSSLYPTAYAEGEKVCNHIQLFLKLPKLFKKC
jgi:hypothetical protein